MCAEAVPWRCHRSLIADALTVLGIRVEDIMSKTRSQLHSLTSFGRVRHGRITYPSEQGQPASIVTAFESKSSGKERRDEWLRGFLWSTWEELI